MSEYVLEPLEDATFGELGPLMLDAFGDRVDRRYFDWKYRQNPAGPARGNVARTVSGDIAAFYGMIPELCEWLGDTRRVYQSCDTMTHSAHRRQGLFQRLALKTYAEAEQDDAGFFVYGFGGATSTPGFVKMGWRIDQTLPFLARPALVLPLGASSSVRELTVPNAHMEQLFEASYANGPAVQRSREYLRWRSANPLRIYRHFVAERAFAIVARAPKFLFLVDFWQEDHASGRPVIAAIVGNAIGQRTKGVLTLCSSNGRMGRDLRRHWFIRNPFPRGPGAGSTPFISYGQLPFAEQEWDIGPIDHDSH